METALGSRHPTVFACREFSIMNYDCVHLFDCDADNCGLCMKWSLQLHLECFISNLIKACTAKTKRTVSVFQDLTARWEGFV